MKKIIKWGLIIFVGLMVLGAILGDSDSTESPSQGESQVDSQIEKQEVEEQVTEDRTEVVKPANPTEVEVKTQSAILSGADPETGEVLVPDINVWEEAGSGGPSNVTVGRVPHNTKVEVIDSKDVDGVIFYHILSSTGEVSVLPTDFEARGKAMEKRPENEWFVEADATFPVEGWVTDSFITNLQ